MALRLWPCTQCIRYLPGCLQLHVREAFFRDWAKDPGIVATDKSCHVAHIAIATFHIVSVEQLVIPMVAREMFVCERWK